jgi:hypothetical protein
MANGWLITAFRKAPGVGSAAPVRFLVAIPERQVAIEAIMAWYPDARVVVDCEVAAEFLAEHGVKDGSILVMEGSE